MITTTKLVPKLIDVIKHHIPIEELRIEIYEDIICAMIGEVDLMDLEICLGNDPAFDRALRCE